METLLDAEWLQHLTIREAEPNSSLPLLSLFVLAPTSVIPSLSSLPSAYSHFRLPLAPIWCLTLVYLDSLSPV